MSRAAYFTQNSNSVFSKTASLESLKRYKPTGTESARVRHFVHVAMFRIPPFHVRNARAINVSS